MRSRLSRAAGAVSILMGLAACSGESSTIPTAAPPESALASRIPMPSRVFTVTSPAFTNGSPFPALYACPADAGGAIAGGNKSPALNWSNVPEETEEIAVVLDDPDAPDDAGHLTTFTHWITWGLDDDRRGLSVGQNGPRVGNNDLAPFAAQLGLPKSVYQNYFGPCPPAGTGVHHYTFHVFALRSELSLRSGATRAEFDRAIAGKVLGEARLTGLVNSNTP